MKWGLITAVMLMVCVGSAEAQSSASTAFPKWNADSFSVYTTIDTTFALVDVGGDAFVAMRGSRTAGEIYFMAAGDTLALDLISVVKGTASMEIYPIEDGGPTYRFAFDDVDSLRVYYPAADGATFSGKDAARVTWGAAR